MTQVIKYISLKAANIRELTSGKIKEIAGSPEIKGVRGTDKRKYLIDMMRVHPRDANYPNKVY